MVTFIMFGKYTAEALGQMSAERTEKAVATIEQYGGEVDGMYATLGKYDLVLVIAFPAIEDAMKASVALQRQTGIAFMSMPAIAVQDFDELMASM